MKIIMPIFTGIMMYPKHLALNIFAYQKRYAIILETPMEATEISLSVMLSKTSKCLFLYDTE